MVGACGWSSSSPTPGGASSPRRRRGRLVRSQALRATRGSGPDLAELLRVDHPASLRRSPSDRSTACRWPPSSAYQVPVASSLGQPPVRDQIVWAPCGAAGYVGWPGWGDPDAVGPHHFVVLVLDDVAVPDELAGVGEPQPQPGHLARVGDHGVLPAVLPGLRRGRVASELDRLDDLAVLVQRQACRLTTWKATSWMCIGWASAVAL